MATLTVPIFRRLAQLGLCLSACVTLACSGGTASVDGGRGGDRGAAGGTGGASNSGGTGAYKDLTVSNNDWVDFAPGTYFFYNATIKITGGTVTCIIWYGLAPHALRLL